MPPSRGFSSSVSLLESKRHANTYSDVLSPFLVAGKRIAIPKRHIIELKQSNAEVPAGFEVDSASDSEREIHI